MDMEDPLFSNKDTIEEQMALNVLRRWQEVPRVGCHLVTEHIETRSLYNPSKPGKFFTKITVGTVVVVSYERPR